MTPIPKPPRRPRKPARRIVRHTPVRKVSARRRATGEAQDYLWAYAVKVLWGWRCARCEASPVGMLDAHHIRTRRCAPQLRHSLLNGVALCRSCHEWAHRERAAFKAWAMLISPEVACLWEVR